MRPEPGFLAGRAEARCIRDRSIAELRICRMAAALQAGFIIATVGILPYVADPMAPAIGVFGTVAILGYATWALVKICRLGVFLGTTIEATGVFLEGRAAEAVRLFELAKDESA